MKLEVQADAELGGEGEAAMWRSVMVFFLGGWGGEGAL